jgi:hypothetical protein
MNDYAPLLISTMFTPITTQMVQTRLPDGRTFVRKAYWREGLENHELIVADATLRVPAIEISATRNFAAIYTEELKLQSQVDFAHARTEVAVGRQNRLTEERNERIAAALGVATGEKLEPKPELWWKWWLDLNEWSMPYGKGTRAYYEYNRHEHQLEDLVDKLSFMGLLSCLNAGTPVWTDQGPVSIERVKIGDLVLSRNVETGELAYKPVLLTTVRPKRQLTEFTVGQEKFQTTGGHLFWGSGNGWVRAKELQPSQVLHTASSPVSVGSVQPGVVAETYNLVVDDFHTYFVGKQRLLSHDNTVRQPTRMIVPGLAAE